jgi:TRAP-type C4-dicarboxylate transport system permease large subunit
VGVVVKAMKDAANTTAMLFLINIGALYYSRILAMTRVPTMITEALRDWQVSPFVVLLGVIVVMYFLGMIMVPVGIYALTLPIAFPLLVSMGYDPIWFGVIALKLTEIGCLTPPVGLNAFAMKGVVGKEISLETIFSGCMPFIALESVCLIILVAFPGLSTWLPNLLFGQ